MSRLQYAIAIISVALVVVIARYTRMKEPKSNLRMKGLEQHLCRRRVHHIVIAAG